MLIAYSRFWQDGIERLENFTPPVKDEQTGHYYFDDFRISLHAHHNENDGTSGVGVLIFAPNGLIWSQQSVYCHEFNKYGSFYYAIEQILEEAEKSKAKNLTIFVDDKQFAKAFKYLNPYKDEAYNKLHAYIIDKLKKYNKCQVLFRTKYPEDVKKRLQTEAEKSARAPEFNNQGRWENQTGIIYFNIKEQTEEEMKAFAEQYARIYLDFIEGYMKEIREEIGEEKLRKFVADVKAGKVKSLPDVKRVREKKERFVRVRDYPKLAKPVNCHKCEDEMVFDKCLLKYPEKQFIYYFRCNKCKTSKELNEKGRVITYGKYPKKIIS